MPSGSSRSSGCHCTPRQNDPSTASIASTTPSGANAEATSPSPSWSTPWWWCDVMSNSSSWVMRLSRRVARDHDGVRGARAGSGAMRREVEPVAEVLLERAAEGDVDHLHPTARAEHGHVPLAGEQGERDLELVADPQRRIIGGMRLAAVQRRVEVAAARQEQAVDQVEQATGIVDVHVDAREEQRCSAGLLDRGDIGVRDGVGGDVDPRSVARGLAIGDDADEGNGHDLSRCCAQS